MPDRPLNHNPAAHSVEAGAPYPLTGNASTITAFTQALAELADEYPTDPEGTAPVTVTVKQHEVPIQPGHLDWLTALVRAELDTFRNAHSDGSGHCGHCRGTGLAGGHGGAAQVDELPADDGSRP